MMEVMMMIAVVKSDAAKAVEKSMLLTKKSKRCWCFVYFVVFHTFNFEIDTILIGD